MFQTSAVEHRPTDVYGIYTVGHVQTSCMRRYFRENRWIPI